MRTSMIGKALIIAVCYAAMFAGVAYAITITVDGIKEAAWDGDGVQTPGSLMDGNEAEIPDQYDIKEFKWTNDGNYMYFLMETYATTVWNPFTRVILCLDTDNNTSTGGTYANCNNMSGVDRSILVYSGGINIYNGIPLSSPIINTGNEQFALATVFTEFRVELSTLGIDTAETCNTNIRAAIYFDNDTTEPDDNSPDAGTFNLSCGTPTAISLASFQASSPSLPAAGWVILPLVFFGVLGAVGLRRQRRA